MSAEAKLRIMDKFVNQITELNKFAALGNAETTQKQFMGVCSRIDKMIIDAEDIVYKAIEYIYIYDAGYMIQASS